MRKKFTAIALQEKSTDSPVDRHFGKCSFFLLVEEMKGAVEIIPNPAQGTSSCKGETIVNELIRRNVVRVIAGDFGSKVQHLLHASKIQMIIFPHEDAPVSEILDKYLKRK